MLKHNQSTKEFNIKSVFKSVTNHNNYSEIGTVISRLILHVCFNMYNTICYLQDFHNNH